jgi:multidrug efflux pump subunit AcrA (membrane-fusion protein)
VTESYINRVAPSQDVVAVLDAYPDWQIPSRVITLVPAADRQKATVLVRIGFRELDPRILPDMAIKVTFLRPSDVSAEVRKQSMPLVPKAAIKREGDQSFSFVVRGDSVERRAVKLGGADNDRLEVLAGLLSGDRVVISPPAELKDGSKVLIR